jgi:hypothetical protein
MTSLPDIDRARLPLGKRGAFENLLTYPWVVSPAWEGWAEAAE